MTRTARVAAVALLITLSGCAALEGLLRKGIVRPAVSVLSVAPTSADLDGIGITADLRIENPNAVGLRVVGLAWQLDVEGGRLASGDAPGGLNLPANGVATSRLTARVRFADLATLAKVGEGKEKVAFHVDGKVTVETPIGPLDVPWSFTGELPVPKLPRVDLAGVRVVRQTLTDTEVMVALRIQNPNSFALPASVIRFDVELGGERVAQASSRPLAAIPAGESATLEVPVRLSVLSAGRALLDGRRKPLRIAAQGTAGFGWMQLPFSVSGELPFLKGGVRSAPGHA